MRRSTILEIHSLLITFQMVLALVTVSKLVGHKRLSTTEKYLNLLDEKDNGTHQKLSAL